MAKSSVEAVLAAVPLFDSLSKRQIKKIGMLGKPVLFMAGHSIVREGETGESFFVVLEGQGRVLARGRTINRLLPGDHFGEISLLDGGPRSATVESETPMRLFELTRRSFLRALRDDTDLAIAMLESLARTVRRVDRSLAR